MRYAKECGSAAPVLSRKQSRTGYWSLKARLRLKGLDAIDKRSSGGVALMRERDRWIQDSGGLDSLSSKELAIIDKAILTDLYIRTIDTYLMQQQTIIRKRSVIPVVLQRQQLVRSLHEAMQLIGLKRTEKPIRTLADLAQEIEGDRGAASDGLTDVSADAEGDPQP